MKIKISDIGLFSHHNYSKYDIIIIILYNKPYSMIIVNGNTLHNFSFIRVTELCTFYGSDDYNHQFSIFTPYFNVLLSSDVENSYSYQITKDYREIYSVSSVKKFYQKTNLLNNNLYIYKILINYYLINRIKKNKYINFKYFTIYDICTIKKFNCCDYTRIYSFIN